MEILDAPARQDAQLEEIVLHEDGIYANDNDKQRHLRAMLAIADEIDRPVEEVAGLYEYVLKDMQTIARIPDYLPILVSKRVKQAFNPR